MSDKLFSLPSDSITITSDDCYTPRWVFDAMGLEFDLDVAAPPGGPWHVPAKAYYTAEDDGLSSPWTGLIWCNPPYSDFETWADKWIAHDRGVLLGYQLPQVRWTRKVFAAAEVVTMTGTEFINPDGKRSVFASPCSSPSVALEPSLPNASQPPTRMAQSFTGGLPHDSLDPNRRRLSPRDDGPDARAAGTPPLFPDGRSVLGLGHLVRMKANAPRWQSRGVVKQNN